MHLTSVGLQSSDPRNIIVEFVKYRLAKKKKKKNEFSPGGELDPKMSNL